MQYPEQSRALGRRSFRGEQEEWLLSKNSLSLMGLYLFERGGNQNNFSSLSSHVSGHSLTSLADLLLSLPGQGRARGMGSLHTQVGCGDIFYTHPHQC